MAMTPYLDLAGFKARTLMPVAEVDYVEADSPGFVASRIAIQSSYINGRLRKRYGSTGSEATLPFALPVPEIVLGWLTALVTLDVLRKRGINPQDPAAEMYANDVKQAQLELKEAADSKDGLWDLPPSPNEDDSAVTTGGPLGTADASPYVWQVRQAQTGYSQDAQSLNATGNPFNWWWW